MTPSAQPDIVAAGAVVVRRAGSRRGPDVLLVHRPRYDDWSFPKGKLDRGEALTACAVREVAEETGVHVRLGPRLSSQRYPVRARSKTVHYWMGRVIGDDDVSGYLVNHEIDDVEWLPWDEALARLSYEHDRDTLAEARAFRRKSFPLVVLRHAEARSRKRWRLDDRERPLLATGVRQAERLVPVLAAYDVARVVTSSSVRCIQTVAAYAGHSGWPMELEDGLSEEDATHKSVVKVVDDLLHSGEPTLVCTHRPVLPAVLDALGVPDVKLEPGGMLVAHHRQGAVISTEVHQPR
jgi:8-oxo-dGTP diphosphatase